MDAVEILGIIATLFVLASFMLHGELRIRLVNSFGDALFVVYGVLIRAWSVWILNIAILVIQIYYLTKPNKKDVEKVDNSEKSK